MEKVFLDLYSEIGKKNTTGIKIKKLLNITSVSPLQNANETIQIHLKRFRY